MNIYLSLILVILIGDYLLDLAVEFLNMHNAFHKLPTEFEGFYDTDKYRKSQHYLKETTCFQLISEGFFKVLIIVLILGGGFNFADKLARSFNFGSIITGLVFSALLLFAFQMLNLPFSVYKTFVIEERYGFNRTTLKTFLLDIVKSLFLGAVIGGIVLIVVLWFFEQAGNLAWFYCWIFVSLFQLFLVFAAPVIIMPLFNKFILLEEGELKRTIEDYARRENFKLKGIFKMDGSKRSTKSNAFFTGFGKYRRIVLFDTLIQSQTVDELASVLAHEMGHYKKKHILKYIIISILTTGLMLFILSLFINNQGLFAAFKMQYTSIYASLFFFSFLYSPINMLLSIFGNIISRRHEYEADKYAIKTYKKPEAMVSALKKLTVNNLSNLTPHRLKVFLEYTHPPVLKRIEAIRNAG